MSPHKSYFEPTRFRAFQEDRPARMKPKRRRILLPIAPRISRRGKVGIWRLINLQRRRDMPAISTAMQHQCYVAERALIRVAIKQGEADVASGRLYSPMQARAMLRAGRKRRKVSGG